MTSTSSSIRACVAAAFLVYSHSFPARAQFDTTAWRFAGDATYQSRDQRFLGTVRLFETVYLPLRKGANTLVVAVTEAFGGWGVAGALENATGVTVGLDNAP